MSEIPLTDARRFERYQVLREHGFTITEIARDLMMPERELQALAARMLEKDKGAVIVFRSRKLTGRDQVVAKHLKQALHHHGALSGSHESLGEEIDAVRSAHQRLTETLKEIGEKQRARTTGTLAELGYDHRKVTRDVEALGEALDVLDRERKSAVRNAALATGAIGKAKIALENE